MTMVLTGAAQAQGPPERLVMKPYPGAPWMRITDQTTRRGDWNHESVPPGETADSFTQILTDQGFPGLAQTDPGVFLKQRWAQITLACDSVRVNGPTLRAEGGMRVAYGQIYCGQQKGQDYGVHIFFKIISGDAALYAISLDVHTPASPEGGVLSFPAGHEDDMQALLKTEAAADAYIEASVYVCGGRSADPRCAR
ncbi:MAG TPA: hypothetical protein VGF50_01390 [Caulobacteraceae bacterium]|jgi:hypothetical protein